LADNGTNLERERKPATEADQREDDGLGKSESLEDRRLRYQEEDRAQASTEADNHAELAELLDCAPEDLAIHKSLRGFTADTIVGYMQQFGLEISDLADSKMARMLAQQMTADGEAGEEAEDEDENTEEKAEEKKAEKAPEVRPSKLAELTEPQ